MRSVGFSPVLQLPPFMFASSSWCDELVRSAVSFLSTQYKKGPIYTRDGSSVYDELGQRMVARLIIRLCINTGKHTDHLSRRAIAIVRLVRRIIVGNSSRRMDPSLCINAGRRRTILENCTFRPPFSEIRLENSSSIKHGTSLTWDTDSPSHDSPSRIYTRRMILLNG